MKVYEIKLTVLLLKDVAMSNISKQVCSLIDKCLVKSDVYLNFHRERNYKNYCFDLPYPLPEDKVYKADNAYIIRFRSIDPSLVEYISNSVNEECTESVKVIKNEIKIIPKKHITKLYSVMPVIVKTPNGYWKNTMSLDDYKRLIIENAIKKYNTFLNTKVDENFQLFSLISFKNKYPISIQYKDIKLLGDKLELIISDDKMSQEIAYMLLGTGIGENTSRGIAGFVDNV